MLKNAGLLSSRQDYKYFLYSMSVYFQCIGFFYNMVYVEKRRTFHTSKLVLVCVHLGYRVRFLYKPVGLFRQEYVFIFNVLGFSRISCVQKNVGLFRQ